MSLIFTFLKLLFFFASTFFTGSRCPNISYDHISILLTVDLFPLTAVTDFNPAEALVEVCVRKFIFPFSKTTRPDKRVYTYLNFIHCELRKNWGNQSPNDHKLVLRRHSFLRSLQVFPRECNQLNKPYPHMRAPSFSVIPAASFRSSRVRQARARSGREKKKKLGQPWESQ